MTEVDGFCSNTTHSRAPSPTPWTNDSHNHANNSYASLSTMDQYDEKPLVTHKSYTHLRKQRSRSDSATTDEDISITASAASSLIALPVFANEKRNHDFHALFKSVPGNERLIEDYGCALQKEILLQGKVYISEHHICFNANIFGWITNLVIAFEDIQDIEKKTTAIFIPNAILISTCSAKYFLASFLSRDPAYDLMVKLWKASQAQNSAIEVHHDRYKDDDNDEEDTTEYTSSEYSYSEEEDDTSISPPLPNMNDHRPNFEKQASLASLPTPKRLKQLDDASRRRAVSEAGTRPNVQEYTKHDQDKTTPAVPKETEQIKETTECECSKNDQHFPTVVMDQTYPTTLENMYNLLYNSSFMATFLGEVEKSTDVCIGEWNKDSGCVQTRESTYIKYLGGSIGPKSTKCYLKEDVLYLDTKDYISQLTVTQTPDVPAGSSFNVKTKTCISWSSRGKVRVLVTVLVDFTKSSWLKSTIEKASIDGQQNFYKNLDAAIRKYLDSQSPKRDTKSPHKKRKRRPKQLDQAVTVPPPAPDRTQMVIETLSSIIGWCINFVSGMTISQSIAICVGIMLISNMYIAAKMAGVNNHLIQLHRNHYKPITPQPKTSHEELWSWVKSMDDHESNISDEQLQFYRLAKQRLDLKMVELGEMISKTGHNMNQVFQNIQNQKYQILNSD